MDSFSYVSDIAQRLKEFFNFLDMKFKTSSETPINESGN